jgi:hypothetical protein
MTGFPGSPRLLKGAVVGLDPANPLASVIVFQYNPDSVQRRLRPRIASGEASRGEAYRLEGPPEETIQLAVEIDAADQLERQDAVAASAGVGPTLASLEMLLYPKSALVIANEVLAQLGIIEVIPPEAPLTVLVWGPQRVLPVRLSSLDITEQAFDPSLNPIRAKVDLSMTVLSYHELGLFSAGGALFMAHQVGKEVMATVGGVGAVAAGLPASGSFAFGPQADTGG